ncbi:MAG: hypothetical protein IPN19_08455 [Elusimicrobia bacterium]|nr:hypothetical protein [Elusimicrobiota bacterium]
MGTAEVVSDSASGVVVSSVAVNETGGYSADGNLTNVEVWVSSSGYIDATAVRLDDTSKSFSGDLVAFDQDVTVSTVPLYYIARADVAGGATEGTAEIALEIFTTANTTNNPIAFTNGTEIVAPPSGSPSGLTATAESNLLRVNLSWSGASGADSYSIYRATHSGVTTTDFLLGISGSTSFTDDSIPPNQTMYYAVTGHNRAGGTNISGAANANSVDLDALSNNNIYLRAGTPFGTGEGTMAYESPCDPYSIHVDYAGNVYIADPANPRIRFVPKISGSYFGQAMTANYIYTIAGNGVAAYLADNVAATSTPINRPEGVTVDASGNVYIAEVNNHRIRFVPKSGGTYFGQAMTANYIYTIAGNGTGGYLADNVAATSTRIFASFAVSVDARGNVYIADTYNYRIRFVPKNNGTNFGQAMTANCIYTIAGNGTAGYLADNVAATSTQINGSYGITVDAGGNVYFSEYWNHRIRFVPKYNGTYFGQAMTANYIYTIVTGLWNPIGVSLDGDGNVYIGDRGNNRIRFVPKISGTYFGQAMTANSLYTIAGTGTGGFQVVNNVAATSTNLSVPSGASVDPGGNVYIADTTNHRIRFIPQSSGTYYGQAMMANYIYSIAGNGTGGVMVNNAAATSSGINTPGGVNVDASGNIYIADTNNHRLRYVPKSGGTYFGQAMTANSIYTIAGNGTNGYLADNVAASSTRINSPQGVSVDASGNVYIADSSNNRIRFVPKVGGTYFGQAMTANYIYTIAGNGTAGYLADDVAATSTQINLPSGVTVNASGNIYIADTTNHRIRFVPKTDGTYYGQAMTANSIYTIAGTGTGGYVADNVAATSTNINSPRGVSVDAAGNVSIADTTNHRIRFIPQSSGTYFGQAMTANYIYTIAGNGTGGYLADNVAANATRINAPYGVSVDAGGNLTIADRSNHRIRFVPKRDGTYFGQAMTANYIYTIGGTGTLGFNGENALATSQAMNYPNGVFAEPNGTLYIADTSNFKIRMITSEDFVAPSTSTVAATAGVGQVSLNWSSAGDDGTYNNLTGNYRIQYATYTASWSTGSTPSNATTVTISTTNATPGSAQSYVATGLTQGNTYYFVLWTGDEVPNWSDVSNTASAWLDGTAPSTSTLTAVTGDVDGEIDLSWASAGDDGALNNLTGTYRVQYATYTVDWSTSSTPTDATTVTISTTNVVPGSAETYTATGLTAGLTYYFVLWSGDEVPNWSEVSNTALVYLPVPVMVTLAEAVGQPGWIGQGETQRILGTAEVVSDSASGVVVSSLAVNETGGYSADGNLTNVEVWVSSSGYIDATAVRLDDTSKSFSGDLVAFDQDVTVSTVPLYYIVRADVGGGATEGTFDISIEVYTTANTTNSPLAFSNVTEVVAPPSGSPSGLTATASENLLQVNLTWGAASGSDSYTIYRATHSGVTTTDFLLGISNTTNFADDYIPPPSRCITR